MPQTRLAIVNVQTAVRAQILAMQKALDFARTTITQRLPLGVRLQDITVRLQTPEVVQFINHHRAFGPDSIQEVTNMKDREMVEQVLTAVRNMTRDGLDISICSDRDE